MLEEIAQIASEKAKEIAEQEIKKYIMDNLDQEVDEDVRELTVQRSISQMTFHLNKLRPTDGTDYKEQFDTWFAGEEEEALRKSCYRCVKEEMAKRVKDEDPNMSFLDRYLKERKMQRS